MKQDDQRSKKTDRRPLAWMSQNELKESIEEIEEGAIQEDRVLTQGEQNEISYAKKMLAEKASAAKSELEQAVVKEFGPIQLPAEIPVERILQASREGLERFKQEYKAEGIRLQAKEPGGLFKKGGVKLYIGDFIKEIKDYIGEKRRRPRTIGEVVTQLPYFDWRLSGTTPNVRNQGACNSCWAFAAVAAFESRLMYNAIRLRVFNNRETSALKAIGLSVQDVLAGITEGECLGGNHTDAFDMFVNQGGRVLDFNEDGVPIDVARETVGRKRSRLEPETRVKAMAWGFVFERTPLRVPNSERDIRQMKIALLKYGPLTVHLSIDENKQFQTYREEKYKKTDGVYDIETPVKVNHIALLTGWDDARKAWILLNSFGQDWGGPCLDMAKVKAHFPFKLHNVKHRPAREGGYMYIRWGVSNVGKMASWIETPLLNEEWFEKARSEQAARKAAKRRPPDSVQPSGGEPAAS
ncbi:MAG: cathepsin [Blastocatellia bacterium]